MRRGVDKLNKEREKQIKDIPQKERSKNAMKGQREQGRKE
jgi:hypothetical protein